MAGNLKKVNAVASRPFIVTTDDTALTAFLRSLCGTGGDSVATLSDAANDCSQTDEPQLLWAAPLVGDPFHGAVSAGTAYIVSQEAYKRAQSHRYSGG